LSIWLLLAAAVVAMVSTAILVLAAVVALAGCLPVQLHKP
jgi:hypothetical protein